jgi:hypothetical protein
MELPAIAKIVLVFFGVLVASRVKVPLGLALVAGGLGLEAWAGRGAALILADLGQALSRPEIWLLVVNITLILEFGHSLTEEANAKAITAAANRWGGRHGRALCLILVPAAIGLIPMPGGALFSAPLIGQSLREEHWPPAWKAATAR